MISNQADDSEIQQFATEGPGCQPQVAEHIAACEECRLKASQYRVMVQAIRTQERPVFDFDLAELITANLPAAASKASYTKWWLLIVPAIVYLIIKLGIRFGGSLLQAMTGITPIATGLIMIIAAGLFSLVLMDMTQKYRSRIKALDS